MSYTKSLIAMARTTASRPGRSDTHSRCRCKRGQKARDERQVAAAAELAALLRPKR